MPVYKILASTMVCLLILCLTRLVLHKFSSCWKQRVFFGFQIFNPYGYNLIVFVCTGLVGAIAILFANENIQINKVVDNYSSQSTKIFAVILMSYGFLIFYWLVPSMNRLLIRSTEYKNVDFGASFSLLIAIGIVLLVVVAWFSLNRAILFLDVFNGGANVWSILNLRAQLVESEREFYLVQRLIVDGTSWIFCLYLAQQRRPKFLFILFSLMLGVYFLLSLTKLKFVLFVLSLFMITNWHRRFNYFSLLKLSVITLILLLLMWVVFVRNLNPGYLFDIYGQGLLGRIIVSQISSLYPHLEIYGSTQDYLGVSSISGSLSYIFGIEFQNRSGRTVLEILSPGWVEQGIGGVYNTVFFGEAYASFGLAGVVIAPLVVFANYYCIISLARFLSYRLAIAFLIHTGLTVGMMSGFNDYLWNPFLVMQFLLLFGSQVFINSFRYLKRCS